MKKLLCFPSANMSPEHIQEIVNQGWDVVLAPIMESGQAFFKECTGYEYILTGSNPLLWTIPFVNGIFTSLGEEEQEGYEVSTYELLKSGTTVIYVPTDSELNRAGIAQTIAATGLRVISIPWETLPENIPGATMNLLSELVAA